MDGVHLSHPLPMPLQLTEGQKMAALQHIIVTEGMFSLMEITLLAPIVMAWIGTSHRHTASVSLQLDFQLMRPSILL